MKRNAVHGATYGVAAETGEKCGLTHRSEDQTMQGYTGACLLFVLCVTLSGIARGEDWPGWRGAGTGVSAEKNLPVSWSDKDGVLWKTRIAGSGISSPIVW